MARQFAVIGLGQFGMSVARALAENKQHVLAIDKDEQAVQQISDYVTNAAVVNATDEKALKDIGVDNVDVAIVGVGNLQTSILVTLYLKEFNIPNIVAKATSEEHRIVLEKIGATRVISPEVEVGKELANKLISSRFFEIVEMSEKFSIVEITAPHRWVEKTLGELDIRNKLNINIVGIRRKFVQINGKGETTQIEDLMIAPPAKTEINKDDILIVLGDNEQINKI